MVMQCLWSVTVQLSERERAARQRPLGRRARCEIFRLGREMYAALRGDMLLEKFHLVDQDTAVRQNQKFGTVGYVGRVQQLHVRLLEQSTAFALVAIST